MACGFGWDWGPDLQTAGLWRPVHLERRRAARLAAVRPLVTVDGDGAAHVAVHVDVERSGLEPAPSALAVEVRLGGTTVRGAVAPGAASEVVEVVVPDPDLWWPVGYGAEFDLHLDPGAAVAATRARSSTSPPPAPSPPAAGRPRRGPVAASATPATSSAAAPGSAGTPCRR